MDMIKRLHYALFASAMALAAMPAWADQGSPPAVNPNLLYDDGHMWHHAWGWHPGMFLAPFVMLLALIGAVALIVWLVHWANHGAYRHGRHGCPYCGGGRSGRSRLGLDILEERFARGEIDRAEFEDKRKLLGRSA